MIQSQCAFRATYYHGKPNFPDRTVPEKVAFHLVLLLAAPLSLGCGNRSVPCPDRMSTATPPFDLDAMRALVAERNAKFTQAHITGDSAVLNDYFTDDARVLGPGMEAVVGKAAIVQLNARYVEYAIKEFTEVTSHFQGDANHLIDEGTYHMRYGAEDTEEHGKYLNVRKQVNGEWRVCVNMWNTDH